MLQVKPRFRKETGTIVYYIVGTYLRRRVRHSLGTSNEKEANELGKKIIPSLMMEIRDGRYDSGTFGDIASLYISKGHEDRFLEPLIKKFGSRKVETITDEDVFALADELSKRWQKDPRNKANKPWSNETKNRQVVTPFEAVLNFGARIRPPKCHPRLIESYPEKKRIIEPATDDWFRAFIAACEREGHIRMIGLVMFLSLTAARISEACRLEGQDVNLSENYAILKKTKAGNSRRVDLPPGLVSVLSDLALAPGERVFGYSARFAVRNRVIAICKRNNLKYYTTHQWGRHAFAARLLRMNKSLLMVKESGGWASLQVVVESYGHLEKTHITETVHLGAEEFARSVSDAKICDTTSDAIEVKKLANG